MLQRVPYLHPGLPLNRDPPKRLNPTKTLTANWQLKPVDAIRSSITDFGQGFAELDRAANLLLMAGSPGMEEVATRILETHSSFWNDRVQPFITRCLQLPNAPGSNDTVGWEKDSAALGSAIGDLLNKLGDLNASFVNQGIKDLQILR